MSKISYDPRAVTVDGQRVLTLAGAMHYPRSMPSLWPELMRKTKAAGLNTVETYVFWNLHERERGVYDFSGRLDLRHWCELAAAEGLRVILRIGPYVCAETNYGGFPPWLRDVEGMTMRTWNPPFMREMETWCRLLVDYLRPMFAPAGGPIVMAQFENEFNNVATIYKEDGQRYLQWCVQLADSLNFGVPCVMCAGGAKGAIETINAFYAHLQLGRHWQAHPDQPALWTEFYTGWYDTYGYPPHKRDLADIAYAAARFFAGGGVGINYFMWYGGTNFGRDSMYLQAASYDLDAPIDEFGLETTKFRHLSRLHAVLNDYADVLVGADRPDPVILGGSAANLAGEIEGTGGGGSTMEKLGASVQTAWTYKKGKRELTFLCNDDAAAAATVEFNKKKYTLAPQSVILLGDGEPLLNTADVRKQDVIVRAMKPTAKPLAFESWAEPMPDDWPDAVAAMYQADQPIEQLRLTQDRTDYCWYQAAVKIAPREAGRGTLTFSGAADMMYVYVDGRRVAATPTPLAENRNLELYPQDPAILGPFVKTQEFTFRQEFELTLAAGEHELAVLCNAMGLVKGEWMLGMYNMVNERKGLWGDVLWNGRKLKGPWLMQPGLLGEHVGAFSAPGLLLKWKPLPKPFTGMRWLRATFDRPRGDAPLALDMIGLTKGMIYLNGQCVSRYWTQPGDGVDPLWGYRESVRRQFANQPTQRYYHLPADWLDDINTLTIFEETGGDAGTVRVVQRK